MFSVALCLTPLSGLLSRLGSPLQFEGIIIIIIVIIYYYFCNITLFFYCVCGCVFFSYWLQPQAKDGQACQIQDSIALRISIFTFTFSDCAENQILDGHQAIFPRLVGNQFSCPQVGYRVKYAAVC